MSNMRAGQQPAMLESCVTFVEIYDLAQTVEADHGRLPQSNDAGERAPSSAADIDPMVTDMFILHIKRVSCISKLPLKDQAQHVSSRWPVHWSVKHQVRRSMALGRHSPVQKRALIGKEGLCFCSPERRHPSRALRSKDALQATPAARRGETCSSRPADGGQ